MLTSTGMAGSKGNAVRRSTRKATNRDGNTQGGDVADTSDHVHGASGEEKMKSAAAHSRRSKRAAAKAADEDVSSAEAICSPAEEVATKQADGLPENGADTDGSAGSDTDVDDGELDVFEEGTREAVDTFEAAVAEPAAFMQPSAEISRLARRAAQVMFCTYAAQKAMSDQN